MRLYILSSIVFLGGCSLLKPLNNFEKSYVDATAQPWVAGAARADGVATRGVTFRMKFYTLQTDLVADTLWINNTALLTEITEVADTTYVSAFYYTQNETDKTLVNDATYSGKLKVLFNNKNHVLGPKPFRKLPVIPYM